MSVGAGRDLTPSEKQDQEYDNLIRTMLISAAVIFFVFMVFRGYANRRDPNATILLTPGSMENLRDRDYKTPMISPDVPIPIETPEPIIIDPEQIKQIAQENLTVDDETGAIAAPPPDGEKTLLTVVLENLGLLLLACAATVTLFIGGLHIWRAREEKKKEKQRKAASLI